MPQKVDTSPLSHLDILSWLLQTFTNPRRSGFVAVAVRLRFGLQLQFHFRFVRQSFKMFALSSVRVKVTARRALPKKLQSRREEYSAVVVQQFALQVF